MILVLSDGIRGHIHQSIGLVDALGIPYDVVSVRWKKGTIKRILETRRLSRYSKKNGERSFYISWLEKNVDMDAIDGIHPCIVVSTGSKVAPVNLAVSRLTGARSVVCMLPEHIDSDLFDLLIVPKHDVRRGLKGNFIVSTGAINMVKAGPPLVERSPILSVLVGGNDANYTLSMKWAKSFADNVLKFADMLGAELWVTTSRRTNKNIGEYLFGRFFRYHRLKEVILAHRTDKNPVPEMLYTSKFVIVTEDSVAMVSEAASSGALVFVARVYHKKTPKQWIDSIIGCGVSKFDRFLKSMQERNYIYILPEDDWLDYAVNIASKVKEVAVLREAERIASILKDRWGI